MPVCWDAETARFARVPRIGVGCHDAAGVVQDEVDGVFAVVGVERVGLAGGRVEAVNVLDVGLWVWVGVC